MPMPKNVKVIDLHMYVPTSATSKESYDGMRVLLRDRESLDLLKMPAGYMFKDPPTLGADKSRYVEMMVSEMDRHNIGTSLIGVYDGFEHFDIIEKKYKDRFLFCTGVNPNNGMDEVRRIKRLHRERNLRAVTYFAAASFPQVPINGKEMYPIYATCCELDIPILANVGVPGPRIPMACQRVDFVGEVCWFFPELKFIMRHGAEPWADLAAKLLLKWPNLYYSTSAFAPKYYPKEIVDFANKRGADKVMYAGYFPNGLTLDRIFSELEGVPFRDEVWPKFLRGNAARVFGLD